MLFFCKNIGNVEILKNDLTIVSEFFWFNFWNLLDFEETAVTAVFGVSEFESDLKIWVAPFLGALDPIFARNFGITREW